MKPTRNRRTLALWALLGACSLAEAALVNAVEYVGDHVFLTANPAEIAALDSGGVPGWTRTGLELLVHDAPEPGLLPVCRFYSTRFAPRSVHFFTAFAEECHAVKSNPDWTEEGVAFYAHMPDAQGACQPGTRSVYRWYNGGRGGIPRHRLTPFLGDEHRNDPWVTPGSLLPAGWVREGMGTNGTAFCAHRILNDTKAETGHLDLLRGSRWVFRTADGLSVTLEFSATIRDSFDGWILDVTEGDRRGTAYWNRVSGDLEVWTWMPPGFINKLLALSFTGRNVVEGCYHREDPLIDGPVGGGPFWAPCKPVVGDRE